MGAEVALGSEEESFEAALVDGLGRGGGDGVLLGGKHFSQNIVLHSLREHIHTGSLFPVTCSHLTHCLHVVNTLLCRSFVKQTVHFGGAGYAEPASTHLRQRTYDPQSQLNAGKSAGMMSRQLEQETLEIGRLFSLS